MPQLCITTGPAGPGLHGTSSAALPRVLRSALTSDAGPVTVMIHGYKYQPGHPKHCPHMALLSCRPRFERGRIVSWPRRLGLRGQRDEGLALSFGWPGRGSVWRAFERALTAGRDLAGLLEMIHAAAPGRPVHLFAHSMGVRVALEALRRARPGIVRKAVLLAGAEFQATAMAALQAPGAAACEVLNVTSRENDLFDFMLERLVAGPFRGARVMGAGGLEHANTVTLQLDDPASLTALCRIGFPIAAADHRICHWSPYLRPGVFPLYRAFLSGQLPLETLRATLPLVTAPRWSRLTRLAAARPTSRPVPISL